MHGLKNKLGRQVQDLKIQAKNEKNRPKTISIDDINVKYNPRKTFNPESLKELAESINENGLMQPIVLDEHNNLIAGQRRIKAYEYLKLNEIEFIRHSINVEKSDILSITENLQRDNLSVLEVGAAIENLIKKYGWKQVDIAKHLNKSRSWVSEALSLYKQSDKKFTTVNISKEQLRRAKKINKEQLSIYFKFTLADKKKEKMSGSQFKKVETILNKVEKLKNELNEVLKDL